MVRSPWLLLMAALVSGEGKAAAPAADLVLRGGRVWAGKGQPSLTAIAVGAGRVMAVGSDADLVLVDLEREWVLSASDLSTRWPISPFIGRHFKGNVTTTLVRGTVVWRDGAAQVAPGFGQLVSP